MMYARKSALALLFSMILGSAPLVSCVGDEGAPGEPGVQRLAALVPPADDTFVPF